MSSSIRYITQAAIDKAKWDACISSADNGLIYAYSTYLDHMADQWDALVLDDYTTVMPLTWRKKYGIHYLYQPFLTAQLGIFGHSLSATVIDQFIQAIPSKFKYWDIYLNQQNTYPLNSCKLYLRRNFTLALNKPYDELYANYRDNIKRNINKAKQSGCTSVKGFPVDQVIALAIEQLKNHDQESIPELEKFKKLFFILASQHKAITYGIRSAKGELIASCVFTFSHHRAYYILVGNHPDGRTIGASHYLIDSFIKDHAGEDLLLDFEGSDIRNLAFFYSSFGAVEEKYAGLLVNRLPFYLKWLKKS